MTAHDDPCVHCGYDEENCICDDEDFMDNLDCTHCGGTGECDDNANPLWDCDDLPHACHACGGTGNRSDQMTLTMNEASKKIREANAQAGRKINDAMKVKR